ncbi:hypothetical protein [Frigoriflavimonas asaccharolytica]|uniref:Uncharacterized protein n=1 Tax=Frigoriflavimonas asaccharolytica TaxID=2735899 RepID=A0A8J8G6N6_9FLAO|nr:hypothetical protein [Frigoriflavimonas asaccharolytica]NRS91986.1 hypothetical protein [Frigoriflavimonas asaccharolytica]
MFKQLINVKLFALVLILITQNIFGQVLPTNRYYRPAGPLDITSTASSFGYSLRKLKNSYSGFSIKIRNGSTNAEANVAFDNTGVVSTNSEVTITLAGGGFSVGNTTTLSSFKGSAVLYVTTWYDQGATAYDSTQTIIANQPQLQLNTAGSGNTKPSIYFDGSNDYLAINQPIQNIVNNGITGSFVVAIKPLANNNQFSFGYINTATNWRWSFHVNWSDGNSYFDSGENCCASNRRYYNAPNIGLWKQYSFIRGTSYKTVRVSGATTALNNSAATSSTQTGGQFWIGNAFGNSTNTPYTGYMSEVLMFPTDMPISAITPIENDQIGFWNL